jgi:hypothetical protein
MASARLRLEPYAVATFTAALMPDPASGKSSRRLSQGVLTPSTVLP